MKKLTDSAAVKAVSRRKKESQRWCGKESAARTCKVKKTSPFSASGKPAREEKPRNEEACLDDSVEEVEEEEEGEETSTAALKDVTNTAIRSKMSQSQPLHIT